VATDGTLPAVEQARTVLENAHAYPGVSTPSTIGDIIAQDNSTNSDYQQLANVVILISLPIAGCTLGPMPRGPATSPRRGATARSPRHRGVLRHRRPLG
jgi:hypothetical protein